MELKDFFSNEFFTNVLDHQCEQIRKGKLKLVDPGHRKLTDQERLAHKQTYLEQQMERKRRHNRAHSPLLST